VKKQELALCAVIVGILSFPAYNTFDTYVLHHGDAKYAATKSAAKQQTRTQKEMEIQKNCAAARVKYDQLYKSGVANPDEQVDVRAACEPDKVQAEAAGTWMLLVLGLAAAFFLLPMLLWGLAPG